MGKAVIFNIMRYSVHDGPGIRTTVFFKGCPMFCKWCHNPESIDMKHQSVFNPGKCINCGRCSGKADNASNARGTKKACADNCPTGARETIGFDIGISELMDEINKDRLFHEQSGGGVTFSGGEPFYQGKFLLEVLESCRDDYINTAIDTSGFCDSEFILKAAETANYFLYDIKFMDNAKHEKYCGVPNDMVLKNLKHLSQTKTKILLRIPVIPDINDNMPEMNAIFEFVKDFKNIRAVHLLPYHNIQTDKYKRIGKQYGLSEISGDESPNMEKIRNLFAAKFQTKTGG